MILPLCYFFFLGYIEIGSFQVIINVSGLTVSAKDNFKVIIRNDWMHIPLSRIS